MNGPKATAHEYLSFPLLLCLSNEGSRFCQAWWVYLNGVKLDFSRPGKPTDNAFIEAFNGRFRLESLNENWFLSLDDAEEKVETWRRQYNGERPHSALNSLSPREFAALATEAD